MLDANGQCNCIQAEGCGCPPIGYDEKGIPIMPVVRNPFERDPMTGGVKYEERKPNAPNLIRLRPARVPDYLPQGQSNNYYNGVDPRIYQTGSGMVQTTGTRTPTTTGGTATATSQLTNFFNQNRTLILIGGAVVIYLAVKANKK